MKKSVNISAVALLALAAAASGQVRDRDDHERRWQEAARLEETTGDVKAALAAFEALVAHPTATPQLRARALLRAGACHERLGDEKAAQDRYRQLLQEEAAAKEERAAAEEALERLVVKAAERHQGLDSIRVAADAKGAVRVTLELKDANVRAVLLRLAAAGKRSLAIGSSVAGSVTLSLRDVELLAALRTIVETVGEYALAQDPTGQVLRVAPVSDLEQQVELRTFRLAARPVEPATAAAWQASLQAVQELLRASRVRGADARLDPATRTLFVRCAPHHAPGVEAAIADVREAAPPPPAEGPRVSLHHEDASVRFLLAKVAAEARRPLLVAPDVRGPVSIHAEDVPWRTLARELLRTAGDFALVATGAGDVALPSHRADLWRAVETWPLSRPPAELWAAGGWTLPRDGQAPRPFFLEALQELAHSLQVEGTLLAVDPVAHRLVAGLPRHQLDAFRDALAAAGHVAPRAAPPEGRLLRLEPGTSLRTAIQSVAAARAANVVLAPDVLGDVDGTLLEEAPLAEVLRALAAATGEFEVVAGQDVLRVVSRTSVEQRLETRRLPLRRRPAAGAGPLARIVSELAHGAQVQGALALHQPEGNFVLASLPAPLLAQIEEVVAACDATDGLAGPDRVVACTLELGTAELVAGGDVLLLGERGFASVVMPGEPTNDKLRTRARRLIGAGLLRSGETTAATLRANLGPSFRLGKGTSGSTGVISGVDQGSRGQLDFLFDERGLLLKVTEYDGTDFHPVLPAPAGAPAPDASGEPFFSLRLDGPSVHVTRHGAPPFERRFVLWSRR